MRNSFSAKMRLAIRFPMKSGVLVEKAARLRGVHVGDFIGEAAEAAAIEILSRPRAPLSPIRKKHRRKKAEPR